MCPGCGNVPSPGMEVAQGQLCPGTGAVPEAGIQAASGAPDLFFGKKWKCIQKGTTDNDHIEQSKMEMFWIFSISSPQDAWIFAFQFNFEMLCC